MKKYTTRWIIALLSIALIGLLCVQLYWVNNAVELKRELFRQSVNGAMSAVVARLEKREVATAVAQTVYADAGTHEAAEESAGEQPSAPAPPPAAPASTAARDTERTPRHVHPEGTAASNSRPVVSTSPKRPTLGVTAVSASGGISARSEQQPPVLGRHPATREFVHLDSMRNVVRTFLDSSSVHRQHTVVFNSMPHLRVRSGRQQSVNGQSFTLSITQSDSAMRHMALQMEQNARKYMRQNQVQWNISLDEVNERMERLNSMLGEMLEESPVEIDPEDFPPPPDVAIVSPRVWVYDYSPSPDTDMIIVTEPNRRNAPAQRQLRTATGTGGTPRLAVQSGIPTQQQAAALSRVHLSGSVSAAGSAVAATSAPVAVATPVTVAVPGAERTAVPLSRAQHNDEKSDRDKLVSIKDMACRVVAELATGVRPIEHRLTPDLLDSLLREELAQRGINLPFRSAVLSQRNGFALATPAVYRSELQASAFRAALYPNDIIAEPYFLSLHFPGQEEFIYESMWGVLATSLMFLLLILGCFSFTLVTLARQKKLSDMKTDFINNMTHEFKTPIATISLASEALRDPAVRGSDNRVMRFVNAIFEENRRLGSQVERVLQAAVIDRGEVQLNLSTVCVHDVLQQAVGTVALQVESRGGTVVCRFDAERDCIQADRVHLANMIVNLLDNANKYSPESPQITIGTTAMTGGIVIFVEDNGIGMSREAQKRIFEKFYRVPTGNLHDTKGFGLGLSYVKAMAEAHGGSVSVRSEPKHGSRFELFLPFSQEAVRS